MAHNPYLPPENIVPLDSPLLFAARVVICVLLLVGAGISQEGSVAHSVGTVESISGNALTLKTDVGTEVNVQIDGSTRLRRISPGEKTLKNAVTITAANIQVGDRILVSGKLAADGKTVLGSSVIALKKSDIAQHQKQELQDWQKRGTGGLVRSVDPASGAVVISVSSLGTSKLLNIHISRGTIVRRYSADSIKFDDAKPASLQDIKPGDQLRARGDRTPDGANMNAEEVVAGTFRNIAGLVTSVDPAQNAITINDLATKKPVTVRIAADSQMHKLPAIMATRLAMRMRGAGRPAANNAGMPDPTLGTHSGNYDGGSGGGAPDMQQMLNRLPTLQFSEFQKGDAVMVVTTEGNASSAVTAITLLSGVEPILTASPNGNGASSLLSPWSLNTSAGDAGP